MNCSPLVPPVRTRIPPALRAWLGARLWGPRRSRRPQHRQACVLALGHIGDFILLLSPLRVLVREIGPGQCVLVVPEIFAGLASRELPGATLLPMPGDAAGLVRDIVPAWWRKSRVFAEYQFAQRICLAHQRGLYFELVLSWIAAAQDFRLRPETYPPQPAQGLGTELLGHWRMVESVVGHPVSREEILPRFTTVPSGADGRLLVYPLSQDSHRTLSVAHVLGVLRAWRGRSRAPIVFGGGPGQRAQLEAYAAALRAAGLPDVLVETPEGVEAFIAHVAAASALFACDSAAAHIGTALDKPTVVLMSGPLWGYCQPWQRSERQKSFQLGEVDETTIAAALAAL